MRKKPTKPIFQIRDHTYRGERGFLIIGYGPDHYRVRIFTRTWRSAAHIRDKLYDNPRAMIDVADFQIGRASGDQTQ